MAKAANSRAAIEASREASCLVMMSAFREEGRMEFALLNTRLSATWIHQSKRKRETHAAKTHHSKTGLIERQIATLIVDIWTSSFPKLPALNWSTRNRPFASLGMAS